MKLKINPQTEFQPECLYKHSEAVKNMNETQNDTNICLENSKSIHESVMESDAIIGKLNDSKIDSSTVEPYFSEVTLQIVPDEAFTVKNLDTGQQVDIREENRESFFSKFTKLLNMKTNEDIELIYKKKRKMNGLL